MALADSITALGTAIINLVGTRLNRDANNFSTAGTQNLNNMIDSRIGAVTGAPVGTVIAYMGTDEPEGFLLMDGRELSRTTYAALFAVIGTSQGAGDGSTTFNIADMTDGRYLMGSTVAGTRANASTINIHETRYEDGGHPYGLPINEANFGHRVIVGGGGVNNPTCTPPRMSVLLCIKY